MDLELEDTPLRQVLDTVCLAAGCTWSYDEDRGILSVKTKV